MVPIACATHSAFLHTFETYFFAKSACFMWLFLSCKTLVFRNSWFLYELTKFSPSTRKWYYYFILWNVVVPLFTSKLSILYCLRCLTVTLLKIWTHTRVNRTGVRVYKADLQNTAIWQINVYIEVNNGPIGLFKSWAKFMEMISCRVYGMVGSQ